MSQPGGMLAKFGFKVVSPEEQQRQQRRAAERARQEATEEAAMISLPHRLRGLMPMPMRAMVRMMQLRLCTTLHQLLGQPQLVAAAWMRVTSCWKISWLACDFCYELD